MINSINGKNKYIGILYRLFLLILLFSIIVVIIIYETAQPVTSVNINNIYNKDIIINKDNLEKYTKELSSINRTEESGLNKTIKYIISNLESFGINNSKNNIKPGIKYTIEEYSYNGRLFKNIIVNFPGKINYSPYINNKRRTLVIGGHYDSYNNLPGADDNASAVAGLLEISRVLKDIQFRDKDIEIVFFSSEEPPFFRTEGMGSYNYIKNIINSDKKIELAIILEMIGVYSENENSQEYPIQLLKHIYPSKGNFITIVSNYSNIGLTRKIKSSFQTLLSKNKIIEVKSINAPSFIPGIDFSDHQNFWKEGIPSIMITDTAFYRNKNYHTKNDTYEKLNYNKMKEVVDSTLKTLLSL